MALESLQAINPMLWISDLRRWPFRAVHCEACRPELKYAGELRELTDVLMHHQLVTGNVFGGLTVFWPVQLDTALGTPAQSQQSPWKNWSSWSSLEALPNKLDQSDQHR